MNKLLDWVEEHHVTASYIVLAMLVLFLLLTLSFAHAATVNGTFTYPTHYTDGTVLPISSVANVTVEVGTCTTGPAFGTREGQVVVTPPTTTWSVTVPRAFGDFCVRALSTVTSGLTSAYTSTLKVTKVEPPPNPPVLSATITVAYEINFTQWGEVRLGRNVGTVQRGAPCIDNPVQTNKGEYYEIAWSNVKLTRVPKSQVIVTKCAWQG